jgi:hypothetical protein
MDYKFLNTKDFADLLLSNPNKEINFTFDTEEDIEENHPTGWHGAKLIYLFDCEAPILLVGYYGSYNPSVYNIGEIYYEQAGQNLSDIKEASERTRQIIELSLLEYAKNEDSDNFNFESAFCVEIEEEPQPTINTY